MFLPGCASKTLISPIDRTHCIQSSHLLRTTAKQNHSLLIAVVSEIECTEEWGVERGVKRKNGERKKIFHSNVQDFYGEVIMSSSAFPHAL